MKSAGHGGAVFVVRPILLNFERATKIMDELLRAYEEQIELLKQENQLLHEVVDTQTRTLDVMRQELAERRHRDHLVDHDSIGFTLWLLLHDIFPFSLWYHRFD
jgi:hypothetical protein